LGQQNFDNVQIEAVKVAEGVYMLTGAGGNMGLSVGADGAFLIDDQFAPLTDKIRSAVASLTDKSIRFVFNTHWHSDHTGGNENLGESGSLIVAHDNVRARMSVEQFMEAFGRKIPASPQAALPVVTFNDTVTFHLNGEEVHAFHVDPAHTDGDSVIHFRKRNVIHTGDLFFNGRYPFIDLSAGGSFNGVISAAESILEIADEETRIIPGHGPLAKRADLVAYRDMLITVRDRIQALIAGGKSADEVVKANPTEDLNQTWGQSSERLVRIAYDSLKKE
jgi:glyoxylase-like metal-dependent hydrolase (beta-lactamase superfamily II)